ncbi:conserved hypothetical protein [Halomonas sp. 59]|nr:conserved hypothetical protein [Halomonas sp. 156]CAD5280132.1 conserved hypothetical protein [Halomonas sp. 113]CAD5281604.1 conserved hypothetical protein [Halomonas sp. 59]CAD5287684.1 conserved hypothetical protein [Halomonas sp. I3]VXB10920.1 conserved hypothetical protein [Halomonas titanicae]
MSWEYFDDNIKFQNRSATLGVRVAVGAKQAHLADTFGVVGGAGDLLSDFLDDPDRL